MIGRLRVAPMWDESNSGGSGGGTVKPSELLHQYSNDAVKMAEKLADVLNDNHALRGKKRELETQVRDLEAKAPKEGAVVLQGDDAARWNAYQEFGSPQDIKTRLDSLTTAESELATQRRALAIQAAVESGGYVKDRFAALLPENALPVVKEEQQDGKPIQRVYISQGETTTPIEEHERFKPFLDTLTTAPSGKKLPPMGSGRNTGSTLTLEQIKEQKRASGRYSS